MASRFLFNEALWDELEARIPRAKVTRAAVAYVGSGGGGLLPLKKGDKLVVDMSLKAVRSGTTDPREVRKLLRKGVHVFTRASLHAKFFLIDRAVISGSSNISKHARHRLDEAAILTDDPATVRRASSTFDQLCTEPVRKDYLEKCIGEYRPPKFVPGIPEQHGRRRKVTRAKLWIIGGLRYTDIPEREQERATRVAETAEKKLLDFERCEVDYSHYPSRLRFFDQIRVEDWAVTCISDGKGFDVFPPARIMGLESYPRGGGKRRYLLLYEMPTGGGSIRWNAFRRHLPKNLAAARWSTPKTAPIVDDGDADAILRLWDPRGRFKGTGVKR
jgi:hypothetical protein